MRSDSSPLLAGIDVGTTNIKVVIYDPRGTVVSHATARTPTHYPRAHWAYYRPGELWELTRQAIQRALAPIERPERVASIAVTSMGEAAVPVDAHGEPTYDAIAWFDTRTQPQVAWLDNVIGKDALFATTGLSLQPIFGLCKLLWLKQNEPEAFARTVRWLNIADYIAFRLCGVPATDHSLASRTLALDLHRLRWDEGIIRDAGIDPALFAPLVPSGTRLGTVTPEARRETGLPETTAVSAGGHDHVCGALATGVIEPGRMLNSLGTAEAEFLPLAQPVSDPALGRQGFTQGAHVVPGRYYVFGGQYTSGGSVNWMVDLIDPEGDYTTLITEASKAPPGSQGACFLPHLRLANPPYDDPRSRAAFVGLTADVRRGDLARSILEGMAFEARNSLDALVAFDGVGAPRQIIVIGGSTQNALLMQIKASVYGQPLHVAEVEEATTHGAAILGGIGAGVYTDAADALRQLPGGHTTVEPVEAWVKPYDAIFRNVYQRLYPALRSLNHAIHDLQAEPRPDQPAAARCSSKHTTSSRASG